MEKEQFNQLREDMKRKIEWLDEKLDKEKIPHKKIISESNHGFIRYRGYQIEIYSEESKEEDYFLSSCVWMFSYDSMRGSCEAFEGKLEYCHRGDDPIPLTEHECLERFIEDYRKVGK